MMLFRKLFTEKKKLFLILLLILNFLLLVLWLAPSNIRINRSQNAQITFQEIEELNGKNFTFKELSIYFKKLAIDKTAKYAYEVLKNAPIPPNIDMHLLGHIVGDELYKQQGFDGIKICSDDFRNACSHSIVVGLFTDKGEEALSDIANACRNAPGGRGAYTMCFHGLGHGILAYYGYDMEKTIETCRKTATPENNYRESIECIGGSVMEIIGGGFHDRELWEKQRVKYLSKKDPLKPCTSGFMPIEAQGQCFVYLTPYLFEAAGADLGKPTQNDFRKAFSYCKNVPKKDLSIREACFGGFGKEFIVLVQNRDIRKKNQISDEQIRQVYNWCDLAIDKDGIRACIFSAVNSLFWGGENDRKISERFCNLIQEETLQESCFHQLIGAVGYYIQDAGYRKDFCKELPEKYQTGCSATLL